jgi:hypothetical protein
MHVQAREIDMKNNLLSLANGFDYGFGLYSDRKTNLQSLFVPHVDSSFADKITAIFIIVV